MVFTAAFRCFSFCCYGPGPPRAGRALRAQAMCSALETEVVKVVLRSSDCRWIWLPGLPSALFWEHSLLAESGSQGAVAKLNCVWIGTSVSRCSTTLQSSPQLISPFLSIPADSFVSFSLGCTQRSTVAIRLARLVFCLRPASSSPRFNLIS